VNTIIAQASLLCDPASAERVKRILNAVVLERKEVIFIAATPEERRIARKLRDEFPCSRVYGPGRSDHPVTKPSTVFSILHKEYSQLSNRIHDGKNIIYFGFRSGPFITTFTPPHGVACYPFHKLVLGTQCPYDCSYCYLQLTYRITPYPRVYLNLEKLFVELRALSQSTTKTIVLNAGELSDPLALDHIVRIVPEVIHEVLKYPNLELLLLTKSANVHHLPDLSGLPKRVILSASLTSPRNQALFEHGTASIEERINGLKTAQDKGYRIRVRIDPIINSVPGWDDQYESGMIRNLAEQVMPETITLGQPRFYAPLLRLAKKRFPEQTEFWDHLDTKTKDHRIRASDDERYSAYERIIELLKDYFKPEQLAISLCKEDPRLASALGVPFSKKCNCLPSSPKC